MSKESVLFVSKDSGVCKLEHTQKYVGFSAQRNEI